MLHAGFEKGPRRSRAPEAGRGARGGAAVPAGPRGSGTQCRPGPAGVARGPPALTTNVCAARLVCDELSGLWCASSRSNGKGMHEDPPDDATGRVTGRRLRFERSGRGQGDSPGPEARRAREGIASPRRRRARRDLRGGSVAQAPGGRAAPTRNGGRRVSKLAPPALAPGARGGRRAGVQVPRAGPGRGAGIIRAPFLWRGRGVVPGTDAGVGRRRRPGAQIRRGRGRADEAADFAQFTRFPAVGGRARPGARAARGRPGDRGRRPGGAGVLRAEPTAVDDGRALAAGLRRVDVQAPHGV